MDHSPFRTEVRAQINGLGNALAMRREHPTSKSSIRERYSRLEGMLYADWYLSTGETSANLFAQAEKAAQTGYDLNLRDLRWLVLPRKRVESC